MSDFNLRFICARLFTAMLLLMLGFAGNAFACSCVRAVSTLDRVSDASFIVVAQVIATDATRDMKEPQGWAGFVARYRLQEVIKASTPPPAQVYSGEGHGDCGIPLLPAISYVFFAGPEGNVTICSGTVAFIDGSKFSETYLSHIRSLVKGRSPVSPRPLDAVPSWLYETFTPTVQYDLLFSLN